MLTGHNTPTLWLRNRAEASETQTCFGAGRRYFAILLPASPPHLIGGETESHIARPLGTQLALPLARFHSLLLSY